MSDWRCPECGYEDGGSHYHCANCRGVCGLMGHQPADCAAYRAKQQERRTRSMAKKAAAEPLVEEAPILPGYEHDESLDTVTLTGGGPADGTWRVEASLPHVVLAGGDRYVLSDRAAKVYALEVR